MPRLTSLEYKVFLCQHRSSRCFDGTLKFESRTDDEVRSRKGATSCIVLCEWWEVNSDDLRTTGGRAKIHSEPFHAPQRLPALHAILPVGAEAV